MPSRKQYGDSLAQELADIIHETVASTTELVAIPPDDRVDRMIAIGPGFVAQFRAGDSTTANGVTVFAPTDVTANDGRWKILLATPAANGSPGIGAYLAQEFSNCAAANANGLRTATATVAATSTAVLLAGGITELNKAARQIVFTTAGGTAADAPATALITGQDAAGNVQTETVTIAQTATTATSTKFFRGTGLTITFPAADGTGATIAIGWGAKLGFFWAPKVRQGALQIIAEYSGGTKVTNGSFVDAATDAPFGSYAPNTTPDGAVDFVVVAEVA